jgi:3-(3-hydroxy-phenyl)propionate hydroxylase
MVPGSVALDAPVQLQDGNASWLLSHVGAGFTLMVYGDAPTTSLPCQVLQIQAQDALTNAGQTNVLIDRDGLISQRYDMQLGTAYLIRPDQHVCARWRHVTPEKLKDALGLALGKLI